MSVQTWLRSPWWAIILAISQLVVIVVAARAATEDPLPPAVAVPVELAAGLGVGMNDIAVTPDGRQVLVSGAGGTAVVDTATHSVLGVLSESGYGIAMSPDGRLAYLAKSAGDIAVIDLATHLTVRRVAPSAPIGNDLRAVTGDGKRIIIVATDAVASMDVTTGSVTTLVTGDTFGKAVVTPDGARVYLASGGAVDPGPVSVIDTATGATSALAPTVRAYQLLLAPDGRSVYAGGGRNVQQIDTATGALLDTIGTIGLPAAVSRNGYYSFSLGRLDPLAPSSNQDSNPYVLEVHRLGGGTVARARIAEFASNAVLSPDGTQLYTVAGTTLCIFDVSAFN
jgi:DNA-binding beta-propeller fold protein YncE